MTFRPSRAELAWLPLVLGGILLIYLPGLGNDLVFDDGYLTTGLFDDYRSFALRARMLSYGSFVWLQALFGEGWWKQRLANLLIHAAVVVCVWGLYRAILERIDAPRGTAGEAAVPYRGSPALGFAVGFFALNPVAVYAVAYLIQRSILLATLFVTLGLWIFTVGLLRGKWWLHLLALGCYVLAVASKEHAILAPLAAVPIYIVVARPSRLRIGAVAALGSVAIGIAALILTRRYGNILGKPFDEYSHLYLAQLSRLSPDAERHAYGLSIMNQAWLFFRYGVDWFIPWSGWMSISLRPAFPVAWITFPQVLGVAGYIAVVVAGFVLVWRYRDWRALIGLSLLFPALLFATEFATVWVQDPFVLYRSYLWAIGVPGFVFLAVHGTNWRVLLVVGLVAGALLVWQALDRIYSLRNAEIVWTDAIEKLPNDPRAVGRWFPYLNRGSAYVDSDSFALALRDFEASSALGDEGMGAFNMGAILAAQGHPAESLAAFERAQREGYTLYNLPFQRGLALLALHRLGEALVQFEAARAMDPPSPTRELNLLNLGRTALQLEKRDEAAQAFEQLLALNPRHNEGRYLLAMTFLRKGEPDRARTVLDKLVADAPSSQAYYARALANYGLKRKADAIADIDESIRRAPQNPLLREWRRKIETLP
jgi:tetratricopeptide (TPR) repeat protein